MIHGQFEFDLVKIQMQLDFNELKLRSSSLAEQVDPSPVIFYSRSSQVQHELFILYHNYGCIYSQKKNIKSSVSAYFPGFCSEPFFLTHLQSFIVISSPSCPRQSTHQPFTPYTLLLGLARLGSMSFRLSQRPNPSFEYQASPNSSPSP